MRAFGLGIGVVGVVVVLGCGTTPKVVEVAPVSRSSMERDVVLDEQRVAEPADEVADRAVAPEVVEVPVDVGAPYVAPVPFTDAERKARFPRGKLGEARAKNREGLRLRVAGDAAGARAAYAEAVTLSPRFAPARYNLACELARAGDRDGALRELETLARLATPDARLFVARARFDEDFDGLREDARFRGLVALVRFDASRPVMEQYCADPGRIADLIDARRGVEVYVETESAAEEVKAESYEVHATGKGAFDQVAKVLGAMSWSACADDDLGMTGTLKTYRLAAAKTQETCLAFEEQAEWTSQYLACFVNDGGWKLASIAMFPDGPLSEDFEFRLKQKARAAKDRGYRNFGVAP